MLSLEDQVHRIVDQLGYQSSDQVIRRLAEEELMNFGPTVIPLLIPFLSSQNFWIVSSLIEIIGRIGSVENAALIRPFLKTKDLIVLRKSAYALARLGDPDAVDELLLILQHPSWHVKFACADALSLYFNHSHLHEFLYLRFLTAFFRCDNQEDIVMAKFSEIGWDKDILLQNPAKYLKSFIQKVCSISLSPGEMAMLKYFSSLSSTLINDYISLCSNPDGISALLKLQSQIYEFSSLNLNGPFKLLL
jgi:HEAT repeat protein